MSLTLAPHKGLSKLMVPTMGKPVTFQPFKELVHSQEQAAVGNRQPWGTGSCGEQAAVGNSVSAHFHTLSALSICSTKDALLCPELAGI